MSGTSSASAFGSASDVVRYALERASTLERLHWLEAAAPFLAYWLLCAIFTLRGLDTRPDVHYEKNSVSRLRVVASVASLHATGVFTNVVYMLLVEHRGLETLRWTHLVIGMLVLDAIEYWVHRAWHTSLLYERFHKEHHRLKAPYSYAALYNGMGETSVTSPLVGLGFYACGLSWREFLVVTTAAYLSTAHQHTYTGTGAHHWRHHALSSQHNFAQPFLPYWDYLMGTAYVARAEPRRTASTE